MNEKADVYESIDRLEYLVATLVMGQQILASHVGIAVDDYIEEVKKSMIAFQEGLEDE